MKLYYTIFTNVVDGVQETIGTRDMKQAMAARAAGRYVLVGFSHGRGRRF